MSENIKDDIELLMCRVTEMRRHQKDFFARKQSTDKNLAIIKEREVDELLARLKARGYNPDRFKVKIEQNKMF